MVEEDYQTTVDDGCRLTVIDGGGLGLQVAKWALGRGSGKDRRTYGFEWHVVDLDQGRRIGVASGGRRLMGLWTRTGRWTACRWTDGSGFGEAEHDTYLVWMRWNGAAGGVSAEMWGLIV